MIKRFIIAAVRWYQRNISAYTKPKCRFYPTCSCYMIEAVETHGVCKGVLMGIWRILRCNPFGSYGWDPVPPKKPPKKLRAAKQDQENEK